MKVIQKLKVNFNMNTTEEIYFWKSEWERFSPSDRLCNVSLPYLAFRLGVLLFFFGGTLNNMTCTRRISLYFIYLTNWSFTLQFIFSSIYFFRLLWVRWKRKNVQDGLFPNSSGVGPPSPPPRLPWIERIIWVGVNLNVVVPYIVTIGYWLFVFNWTIRFQNHKGACEILNEFTVHALNSFVALMDTMVMAVPIRISHMVFPIITGFIYVFFSGMYEVGHGTYSDGCHFIYQLLDWRMTPGVAAMAGILGLFFAGILHLLMGYGVYRLRVKLESIWLRSVRGNIMRTGISQEGDIALGDVDMSKSTLGYDNPTQMEVDVEVSIKDSDKLGQIKSLD